MSVEIIGDKHNVLGVGKVLVHQLLQLMSKVLGRAPLSDSHSTPPCKGFAHHKDVSHASSLVLVIFSAVSSLLPIRAGSWRHQLSTWGLPSQLLVLLVHAYLRVI